MTRNSSAFSTAGRHLRPLLGCALATLALAGCTDARRAIGLDRQSPDEFAVVSRAPLSMPPDLSLPRPRPGAPRPQEPSPTQLAAATVFGASGRASAATGNGTAGEKALVAQAGSNGIDPSIRATVDQETTDLIVADRRWVDSLLFWRKQEEPFNVVDPQKEAQRLREVQAQGKPINDGTVPTIERRRKAPLEGIF